MSETELKIADLIEGIPDPAANRVVVGHSDTLDDLVSRYHGGRMHHAILLAGPRGIGKSTLAFRFAGHVLRHPSAHAAPNKFTPENPDDAVYRKVAARSHPNLLHLSRPWDWQKKVFSTLVTVDEVRRTNAFFSQSKGEGGWRVVIVDAVDEMNENASNALLKMLEEPPAEALFLVLAHSLSNVPMTIRSRCQHLTMKPLATDDLKVLLQQVGAETPQNEETLNLLTTLSRGSVRRALVLLENDGLKLHQQFSSIVMESGNPDWGKIHKMADGLVQRGKEDQFRMFLDIAEQFLEMQARPDDAGAASIEFLAQWVDVWEKMQKSLKILASYNLDKKQFILELFGDIFNLRASVGKQRVP